MKKSLMMTWDLDCLTEKGDIESKNCFKSHSVLKRAMSSLALAECLCSCGGLSGQHLLSPPQFLLQGSSQSGCIPSSKGLLQG